MALTKTRNKNVIILNGDTLFKIDFDKLIDFHYKHNFAMTIALKRMTNFDRYGNVLVSRDNEVVSFEEKRHCEDGNISGGIYVINNPDIFKNYPDAFSIERDFFENKLRNGKIGGFIFDGYFIDIGIPSDYEKAQRDFAMPMQQ